MTLIDRNQKSLESAVNIHSCDVNVYFEKFHSNKIVCPELKRCFERVCIRDDRNGLSWRIDGSKLKHIKIATVCSDITEVEFPSNKADILISTRTLQYLRCDKLGTVFSGMTNSLKPSGRMITTDHFVQYQPSYCVVAALPDKSETEKDVIYLKFDANDQTVSYCYFSRYRKCYISGGEQLHPSEFIDLQKDIESGAKLQSFTHEHERKIQMMTGYAKHNVVMVGYTQLLNFKDGRMLDRQHSVLFLSSPLTSNSVATFTYDSIEGRILHEVRAAKRCKFGKCSDC